MYANIIFLSYFEMIFCKKYLNKTDNQTTYNLEWRKQKTNLQRSYGAKR